MDDLSMISGRRSGLTTLLPIGSMYGISTYVYHKSQPNVGKYTMHGSYGLLHTQGLS